MRGFLKMGKKDYGCRHETYPKKGFNQFNHTSRVDLQKSKMARIVAGLTTRKAFFRYWNKFAKLLVPDKMLAFLREHGKVKITLHRIISVV